MDGEEESGVGGEDSSAEVVNLVVSACKSFLAPLSPSLNHLLPFTASLMHICTQALPSTSSLFSTDGGESGEEEAQMLNSSGSMLLAGERGGN